jgi:hypothetical protein
MTKPPQQTIGNTVYTVGQVLKNYTEAASLLDYMESKGFTTYNFFRGSSSSTWYSLGYIGQGVFPITITALPSPDVVADEWREVNMQYTQRQVIDGVARKVLLQNLYEPLQLAMQEVCKADERKVEYPKDYFDRPIYCNVNPLPLRDVQDIALCFLLGGTVKVRGGL